MPHKESLKFSLRVRAFFRSKLSIAIALLVLAGIAGTWLFLDWHVPHSTASVASELEQVSSNINVPEGMVYVPGGKTLIGNELDERTYNPRHQSDTGSPFTAAVDPFFMDKHPVTVAQFREFVEATGYTTQAERFGNAGVLDGEVFQWRLVEGANWMYPRGPEESPAEDDHPVTQVSWHDAVAYAEWAGKRLPTEVEWEHAARDARNNRDRYAWGNEVVVEDDYYANIWQGHFPMYNRMEDGYEFTSPVGAFGETELGLTDMGGNVWEWCQDWYRSYANRDEPYTPTQHSTKVQRGGSFQCDECYGYTVYARSHTTPETSLFHVGFRTVRDL